MKTKVANKFEMTIPQKLFEAIVDCHAKAAVCSCAVAGWMDGCRQCTLGHALHLMPKITVISNSISSGQNF